MIRSLPLYLLSLSLSSHKKITCLDVGGSTPFVRKICEEKHIHYSFVDDDPNNKLSGRIANSKQLSGKYDLIVTSHFIEHISLEESVSWFKTMKRHLNPGGVIFIATPNAYWPLWIKYDHIHVWDMQSLFGVLSSLDFQVSIYRLNRKVKNPLVSLKKLLRVPLVYLLDIDFNCEEIIAVCKLKKD